MLMLDLVELERQRTASLDAVIPTDDPVWEGVDLRLRDGVQVKLKASNGHAGQILVRGRVRSSLDGECRRCLKPVVVPVDFEVTLVFVPRGGEFAADGEIEEDDDALLPYDDDALDLDLAPIIREELILAAPAWPVCRADCRGLCPHCGVDRNETACACSREDFDSRWEALRALKLEE